MKPEGMEDHIYKRYQTDGFNEFEIAKIWENTLYFRNKMAERLSGDKEPREITSSTYIRAEKKLTQNVKGWFGNR